MRNFENVELGTSRMKQTEDEAVIRLSERKKIKEAISTCEKKIFEKQKLEIKSLNRNSKQETK